MTISKILKKYTDKQIVDRLLELYPDQKNNENGYLGALTSLRALKPKKTTLTLLPSKFHTSGKHDGDDTLYAIDFTRWEEWLDAPIKTSLNSLTAFCYCLWEMTYHGFKQQAIQRRINKLGKIIDSLKVKEKE